MTSAWLAIWMTVAAGHIDRPTAAAESVDLIEVNHFYDDLGRHVYDQVIFYEWAQDVGQHHVRAWCLLDNPARTPFKSYQTDRWQIIWYDRDQRMTREIQSEHFRETWSQVDPERANKKLLDEKLRTALIQSPQRVDGRR